MDYDSEEHNSQQTRGRNVVGSSRNRNLDTSEGDVPKQEEPKRGRPRSELTDEQKRLKRNDRYKESRKRKKEELQRLQKFANEFQEEFGSSSPRSLKEILSKLGVPEEVLEGIRKATPLEELWNVWQRSEGKTPAQKEILQDKMEEDLSDGCRPRYYSPSAAMNEPIEPDTAESSSFRQTQTKQEPKCLKFQVTKEALEDKEKRTLNFEQGLEEELTKILSEDERTEGPSDVGNEKLTEIMEEEILSELVVPEEVLEGIRKGTPWEELWNVWQRSEGKTPAQKEILQDKMEEDLSDGCRPRYCSPSAAMNEPIEQDTAESSSFRQTQTKQEPKCLKFQVTKEALEDKEKRTLNFEQGLEEELTKILSEDEMIEEPSGVGNEEVTKIMEEFEEALIGSESTNLGSKEVAMNKPSDPDGVHINLAFFGQPLPTMVQPFIPGDAVRGNAAESPLTACMRYLQTSIMSPSPVGGQVHPHLQPSVPGQPQAQPLSSGLLPNPPMPPFPSPRGVDGPVAPMPDLPSPRMNGTLPLMPNIPSPRMNGPALLPSPTSQFLLPSPTGYPNFLSPYPILSPGSQFPPMETSSPFSPFFQ